MGVSQSNTSESTTDPIRDSRKGSGIHSRVLIAIAIFSQLATLLITLPTWQVREFPPNLSMLDVPQIPWLWMVLVFASALGTWWLGKTGSWIHLGVLLLACAWDQYRIQPQFFFGWVFLYAASSWDQEGARENRPNHGIILGQWALIALWFWAGLHKLMSPEWLSYRSFAFLVRMTPREFAMDYHFIFAVMVGVAEVGLAAVALLKPRIASWACVGLHMGIVLSLLIANWNFSVIPWNLLAGGFGFLLFRNFSIWSTDWRSMGLAFIVMLAPGLFYVGQIDRAFAHVLYSGMTARGTIVHFENDGSDPFFPRIEAVRGWKDLAVPFPNERRTLRRYFELTSRSGSKLFVRDPRASLNDQYFVKRKNKVEAISKEEFYSIEVGGVMGVAQDEDLSTFFLDQANVRRLKRSKKEMVYALEFTSENYSSDLLDLVSGYPNLEQIQLAGCPVSDEDLRLLSGLFRLEALGLRDTLVTSKGLKHLEHLPSLRAVEVHGSKVTALEYDEFMLRLESNRR